MGTIPLNSFTFEMTQTDILVPDLTIYEDKIDWSFSEKQNKKKHTEAKYITTMQLNMINYKHLLLQMELK